MAMNVPHILRTYQTTNYSVLFDTAKDYHRWLKGIYKKKMAYVYHDPLGHSMRDGVMYQRYHRDNEDGDNWTYYGFLDADDAYEALFETDGGTESERLTNWFRENMQASTNCEHDCSGRAFTVAIFWHVNPSGLVSYIHHMGLDI